MRLNEEIIFRACEELLALGVEPTASKIRAHLNTTGSQGTIVKYLEAWRQSRRVIVAARKEVESSLCPPDLIKLISGFIQKEREAALTEREGEELCLRAELADLAIEFEKKDFYISEVEAREAGARQAAMEASARAETLQAQNEALHRQLSESLAEKAEAAHLRCQISELRVELAETRAALTAMTERAAEAEAIRDRRPA